MTALTTDQILAREEQRILFATVKQVSGNAVHQLQTAFQEYGCTCLPAREEMAGMKDSYNEAWREVQKAQQQLDQASKEAQKQLSENFNETPMASRYLELQKTVRDIDRAEHPRLDQEARRAAPFFHNWLLSQVKRGDTGVLHDEPHQAYVEAWYGGWRP